MKDQMMEYGILFAKRYTSKQKKFFLTTLSERLISSGYPVEVQSLKSKIVEINNLIVGDIKNSSIVIAAAYDTPSQSFYLNSKYYPFNAKKNVTSESISIAIQFALSLLCFIMVFLILYDFSLKSNVLKVISILLAVLLMVGAYFILKGRANPINFNRNSASIALMMEMSKSCIDKSVAFVFLDKAINSYDGIKQLAKIVKPNQQVILLDSIASGEKLICAHLEKTQCSDILTNKQGLNFHEKIYEYNSNSLFQIIESSIIICCGNIENKQLVVKNTRCKKDCIVEMERLEKIKNSLLDYVEDLK